MAWIGTRRQDLVFFYGSSAFAVALGGLVIAWPVLLVPLVWAWLLLLDGPHLVATWQRTYFDPLERERHRSWIWKSLLLFLPPLVCWGLAWGLGQPLIFLAFVGFAALASWHHLVRQHYGITAVYEGHAGATPGVWKFDKYFMHGILWWLFGLSLLATEANRTILELPVPGPAWMQSAVMAGLVVAGVATAVFLGSIVWRAKRGMLIQPALFALGPVVGAMVFTLFVVGMFEPVLTGASNPEQLVLAATLVGGVIHGMQYIGIVAIANKRRYASDGRAWFARLGRAPVLSYGLWVAVSLAYVALNAGRGAYPGAAWLSFESMGAQFLLALYWGVFFHHYYVDQKIWRIRSDPRLRGELGMA